MTFTILGRDPETGSIGIGIATYSLAVGATCPFMLPDSSVLTSQAAANPKIGETIITLIRNDCKPVEAMEQALRHDPYPEYRQIALLTSTGETSVHSGSRTRPFSGYSEGKDCIAVGNFLKSEQVLAAMTDEFNGLHAEASLIDRLIAALDVNDQGDIVGYGQIGGAVHGFLLTGGGQIHHMPEPASLSLMLVGAMMICRRPRRKHVA